jgi:hypothetical protein
MPPLDRGRPSKRERPALAGTGALKNGNSNDNGNNRAGRWDQGWRPSPAMLWSGIRFLLLAAEVAL